MEVIVIGQEKRYELKVRRWLEDKGIYKIGTPKQKMKVPQIGIYMKNFGCMYSSSNGIPDYLLDIKGRALWLEFKASKGKPSIVQVKIVDNINSWGGIARIIYPKDFEDTCKLIEEVINDE